LGERAMVLIQLLLPARPAACDVGGSSVETDA
jgi:hypothetical protein